MEYQTPLQSWEPSIIPQEPNRHLQSPPTRPPPTPPTQTWDPREVRGPAGQWELPTKVRQPEGPLVPCWQGLAMLSTELEAPLMKRQLKHRRNKDSKLNKEFKRLEEDINNLKSQMDSLKDKITKASESTNARFKRKKIRSMKRDFDKIGEKLKESEAKLESVEQQVPIDPI